MELIRNRICKKKPGPGSDRAIKNRLFRETDLTVREKIDPDSQPCFNSAPVAVFCTYDIRIDINKYL